MWSRRRFLGATAAATAEFRHRTALPGYRYRFPRDHFEHPDFRTEWWYYTGNVRSAETRRFGFELVFFRQSQRDRPRAPNPSKWRIDDLYLAHLALTDIDGGRHIAHKRLNRAGPGIAGASFAQRRLWNGNWSAIWNGDAQILEATAEEFRFRLAAAPTKPLVIHGRDGVSQKAEGAGKASHYVSFSRLNVAGGIDIGGRRHDVQGSAWMDHEWFTHQLESGQAGWDWFSVQLDDGRELMLFQLRRKDGTRDPYSSGTFIDTTGRSRHLDTRDFALTPLERWTSPKTQAAYPVAWRIRVPSLELTLDVRAAIPAQEMLTEGTAGPTYWEGAVLYSGSARGVGYLEMTGYDKAVDLL